MTNDIGAEQYLQIVRRTLTIARQNRDQGLYEAGVQYGQLCVENSAKLIIAFFDVPPHTHNPGPELYGIVNDHEATLRAAGGEELIRRLRILARDAEEIAAWHEWSTYGRRMPDGIFQLAQELCTEERAAWAVTLAERSAATAEAFMAAWRKAADN